MILAKKMEATIMGLYGDYIGFRGSGVQALGFRV